MSLKFFTFILLLVLSLPGLGQEESVDVISADESAADEAAAYRKTQARGHQNIHQAAEALELANQIEAMSKEGLTAASLLDEKVQATLQKIFAQGLFEKETREVTRANLMNNFKGKKIEKLLQRFPKLLDIMTDIMRDREAMPGLIRILGRKADLRMYFQIWVSLFLFSFLFRRYWLKKRIAKQGFFTRNLVSVGFTLFMTTISFMIFYKMFKTDVRPTVAIIRNYL